MSVSQPSHQERVDLAASYLQTCSPGPSTSSHLSTERKVLERSLWAECWPRWRACRWWTASASPETQGILACHHAQPRPWPLSRQDPPVSVHFRDMSHWTRVTSFLAHNRRSIHICSFGDFPGGQWYRLHLPMQGGQVRSLAGELRCHMPRGQKTKT